MNIQYLKVDIYPSLSLPELEVVEAAILSFIEERVGNIVSIEVDPDNDKRQYNYEMAPEEVGKFQEEVGIVTNILSRIAKEKTRLLYQASGLTG